MRTAWISISIWAQSSSSCLKLFQSLREQPSFLRQDPFVKSVAVWILLYQICPSRLHSQGTNWTVILVPNQLERFFQTMHRLRVQELLQIRPLLSTVKSKRTLHIIAKTVSPPSPRKVRSQTTQFKHNIVPTFAGCGKKFSYLDVLNRHLQTFKSNSTYPVHTVTNTAETRHSIDSIISFNTCEDITTMKPQRISRRMKRANYHPLDRPTERRYPAVLTRIAPGIKSSKGRRTAVRYSVWVHKTHA